MIEVKEVEVKRLFHLVIDAKRLNELEDVLTEAVYRLENDEIRAKADKLLEEIQMILTE